MYYVAFLRGVMPTGKNRIPKMSNLVRYLEEAGLERVSSYIQSGNLLFESDLAIPVLQELIHETILTRIGADLSVIIKVQSDLARALEEQPFGEDFTVSRIHLTFTNDALSAEKLRVLKETSFGDEVFADGGACLYMYLPREAPKKRLNNNFLENKLGICATTRKLTVIQTLHDRMCHDSN